MILALPEGDLSAAIWIDLLSPSREEIERVEKATGLRVPNEAQISEIESTSRLAFEKGAYYLSTPLIGSPSGEEHALAAVGFVLSERAFLTVHYAPLASFDEARRLCEASPPKNAEEAFLHLLEAVVDRAADQLEHARSECDEISRITFRNGARADQSRKLQSTLRRLGTVADHTSLVRDGLLGIGRIVAYIMDGGFDGAPEVNAGRLHSIRTDVSSLTDYEGHLSIKVQFLLDATLGFINIEQNEIVKTLTVASVVGIPPVLVAGIYGMNFRVMPELGWRYGYVWALALVVVSGVLPLLWFKRRHWL